MTDQPPNDQVAEQATLGSCLLSKEAVTSVSEILRAEHFYSPKHGDIYTTILALTGRAEPVDPVTVGGELQRRGIFNKIGGGSYLHELSRNVPSPTNAKSYARVVYDKFRQRSLIGIGHRITQLGYADATTSEEVDRLLAEADDSFRELGEPASQGSSFDALVKKWEAWQQSKGSLIYSPWIELNAWLPGRGFAPGQLVIIGGRPGNGKSNAGLNIVLEAAEKGHRATVFSVEMDDVEVTSRLLAAGTHTVVSPIFSKDMDRDQRQQVDNYIEKNKDMPLEVVDRAYITVEKIIGHCRARRPKIIFVDYAQLIQATNDKLLREQQVAHITRSLKVAAKSLQMVVVVASQLKRPSFNPRNPGEESMPTISDLRESGAAEQDADLVILLHRAPHARRMKMIVGKNRNGTTGHFDLVFRGERARVG